MRCDAMRRLFATTTTTRVDGVKLVYPSRRRLCRRHELVVRSTTVKDDDASALHHLFKEKVHLVTQTFDTAPKGDTFKHLETFASPRIDGHRTRASFGVVHAPPHRGEEEERRVGRSGAPSALSSSVRLMTTTPNGGELMDVFDARRVVREESEGVRRGIDALLRAIACMGEEEDNDNVAPSMRAASVLSNRAATEIVVSTTHDRDGFGDDDESAWRRMATRMMAIEPAVVGVIGKRKKTSPHLVVGRGDYVFEETTTTTTFGKRTVVFKHREGSFSNPNPDVAEQTANYLCDVVRALTKDGSTPTRFVELYAGCGNHSVTLAPYFSLGAYAVEINGELVEAARENFARNDVGHCAEIVCAPAEEWVTRRRNAEDDGSTTVLLVDPPRGGLDSKTLDFVSREFDVVIYVACDYKSLRRDMDDKFIERGFAIERLACFDHAPTSAKWIETVAVLVRCAKTTVV